MAEQQQTSLLKSTGDEVASLQKTFGQDCRVILDIGNFTHVIAIKMPEDGLSIKFQICDGYPSEPCSVIVRSELLDPMSRDFLAKYLSDEATKMTGKFMLAHLIEHASDWLAAKRAKMQNVTEEAYDLDEKKSKHKQKKNRHAYWGPKMRPTHFLALRITNPELVDAIGQMQDQILEMCPEFATCVIPRERLHVTLACVGLDTRKAIDEAAVAVNRIGEELKGCNPTNITLELDDVGHFYNTVFYGKVKENKPFLDFVEHLRLGLRESGIEIRDKFDFNPHVTIWKLTQKTRKELLFPYLDGRLIHRFGRKLLGKQVLDHIQLCEMSAEKRADDGFYLTEATVSYR